MPLRLSRHENLHDAEGEPWACEWPDLVEALSQPPYLGDKAAVPLWSPGTGRKRKGGIDWVDVGVLDVDGADRKGVTFAELDATLERLRGLGVASVVHSTHSAASVYPSKTKFRIVVLLARPVRARDWKPVWAKMRATFAPVADPNPKDAGRRYYAPSAPVDAPPGSIFVHVVEGAPWDPASVEAPPRAEVFGPATSPLTRDLAKLIASQWRSAKSLRKKERGIALASVVKGEPFAQAGERDTRLYQLVDDLVALRPETSPESLADLFAPSLALMGTDAPTAETVIAKAQAARVRVEENEIETEPEPDGTKPVALPARAEVDDPSLLADRTDSSYLVRDGEGVWSKPLRGEGARPEILRVLSEQGIPTHRMTSEGRFVARTIPELVEAHGHVIRERVIVIGSAATTYDPATRTLSESAAPLRPLEPTFSPDVDAWIRALAGRHAHAMRTWLALAPRLSEPVVALALIGTRGAGKSLLANGVARLWSETGPCMADSAFGDHNGEILRCPLVFADERLPRGVKLGGKLKEIVQAREHPVRRKYLAEAKAIGAVRLVVAANSLDVFDIDDAISPEDAMAIGERFYVVKVDASAVDWLEANGGPARAERFVKEDEIAKHALWLQRNYFVQRQGRFWIRAPLAEALVVSGRDQSEVIQWIVMYSENPSLVQGGASSIDPSGTIYVSIGDIDQRWSTYLPNTKKPRFADIRRALTHVAKRHTDGTRRTWRVKQDAIAQWKEEANWTDRKKSVKTNGALDSTVKPN